MTFLVSNPTKKYMFAEKEFLLGLRLQEEDDSAELPLEDPDDEELSEDEDEEEEEELDDDWIKEE